jgi:hypothetical protein
VENRDGQDLIHLSCGENDSAIKILTFDKEALLKTLKPIGSSQIENTSEKNLTHLKDYWTSF